MQTLSINPLAHIHMRPFQGSDAPRLRDVMHAAIERLDDRSYNADQLAAWRANCPTAETLADKMQDGRMSFIAADRNDMAVGFADLETDGHVDYLFVAPQVGNQGVASRLLDLVQASARAHGIKCLYAEASEAALGTFIRAGFARVSKRQLWINQTPIHNYAMEKPLVDGAYSAPRAPAALAREWAARFNAADVEGLLALYATDAICDLGIRPAISGHDAIRAIFEKQFEGSVQPCLPDTVLNAGQVAILESSDLRGGRTCEILAVERGLITSQRRYEAVTKEL